MKKCPYCAEEIQDEAIKCRYCKSEISQVVEKDDLISEKNIETVVKEKKLKENSLFDKKKILISMIAVILFFGVIYQFRTDSKTDTIDKSESMLKVGKTTNVKEPDFNQKNGMQGIHLEDTLSFMSNTVNGTLVGFVAFDDKEKQPKNAKQYYILNAKNVQGENIITLKNMISLYQEPLELIEELQLEIVENTNTTLGLVDKYGILYVYDKERDIMVMYDGDYTYLITSDQEYEEFINGL